MDGLGFGGGFIGQQYSFDIEKTQSFDRSGRAFQAFWIMDHVAQHLISTTKAKHAPAATDMRFQINVPACFSQCFQIRHCGFAARDDDQSGITRNGLTNGNELHIHIGL